MERPAMTTYLFIIIYYHEIRSKYLSPCLLSNIDNNNIIIYLQSWNDENVMTTHNIHKCKVMFIIVTDFKLIDGDLK